MQKKQSTLGKRYLWLLIFLGCVFSVICSPTIAQENFAGHAQDVLPYLHSVYADNFVEIRSDVIVLEPSLIAGQIARAYKFDLDSQSLRSSTLYQPVIVGLYSNAVWAKGGGNAVGTQYFFANVGPYIRHAKNLNDQKFAWFVTAHELEHLIMNRMNTPVEKVPVWLFEGIACSLGYHFAATTEEGPYDLHFIAERLASYTKADAEETLKTFVRTDDYAKARDRGKVWQYEHIGGLFFEHLISLYASKPDYIYHCWGKVVENLGSGVPFESAFKNAFSFSLAAAESDFLSYMQKTTGNPKARFAGTILSNTYM